MPDIDLLFSAMDDDELDLESDDTDSSSSVITIPDDEIPQYFAHYIGRLYSRRSFFHSHGSAPYPLPCDTPEQERLNSQHEAFKELMGSNYFGPVAEVLSPASGRRKTVVDICTGTGKWVEEMATEFRHVRFIGLDIVPLATRYPRENTQFEVHDASTPLRWEDGAISLVHIRDASHGITDFPRLLREIARIMEPGGLLLSREWEQRCTRQDGSSASNATGANHFFSVVNAAMFRYGGLTSVAPRIPAYLDDTGAFVGITHRVIYVHASLCEAEVAGSPLAGVFARDFMSYAQNMMTLLSAVGMDPVHVQDVVDGLRSDLESGIGLAVPYHITYAHRR